MKMGRIVLFLLMLMILNSCGSQKNVSKKGFLTYRFRQYDSSLRTYSMPFLSDINVWYHNKLVIQEVFSMVTKSDTLGQTTTKKRFEYYLFIDRESKTFFHYSSFSDTARILDSYIQADTAILRGKGGWQFYGEDNIQYSDLSYLSDTLIDKVNYKRVKFTELSNGKKINVIGYLRCDRKGTMFQIGKNITNLAGCPMVKYEQIPSNEILNLTSSEIVFERDSLTEKEVQIFKAWKRNEAKFPLKSK
jgi:hypothetical protein